MSAATFTPWSSSSWSPDTASTQFSDNYTVSSHSTLNDDPEMAGGPGTDDWKYALNQIRQQMYSTTGVGVPSPARFFEQKNLLPPRGADCLGRDIRIREVNLNTSVSDIGTYRQHRSDNLVMRMLHCHHNNLDRSAVIPLGKGMYIHTQWQSKSPAYLPPSPQSSDSDFERILSSLQPPYQPSTFVPHSYTFGVRYTDAYGYASDVLIRGRLPLWCQTLFLSECVKQMPIRANETRTGLFVFAPEVAVTFQSLANSPLTEELNPEATLDYERLAMELSEPELLFVEGSPDLETKWEERKQKVIQRMVYCDIPDDMAQVLTDIATAWACGQGFML
ncbi:hypothetical protein BJV82DRAFT_591439 [Fennellomyces sp. T-0311]|nr:hypothetical protein BJV82DRAFT_591439 [Fennellomyces sp. T-0311]